MTVWVPSQFPSFPCPQLLQPAIARTLPLQTVSDTPRYIHPEKSFTAKFLHHDVAVSMYVASSGNSGPVVRENPPSKGKLWCSSSIVVQLQAHPVVHLIVRQCDVVLVDRVPLLDADLLGSCTGLQGGPDFSGRAYWVAEPSPQH